jgi:hypothetical protein
MPRRQSAAAGGRGGQDGELVLWGAVVPAATRVSVDTPSG